MSSRIYTDLAIKDVFRLWSASQLQIIIIAGICLPILLLLGLKNGHVADLREDLVTSPVGRQVVFWSAKQGEFLTKEVLGDLERSIPNVSLIIPESQKLVFISHGEGNEAGKDSSPLTLYSTLPGDPILTQFNADIGGVQAGSRPLILSEPTARALGKSIGDSATITIKRRLGAEEQDHPLDFKVVGTVASGDESGGFVGFTHLDIMACLEKYGSGEAVPELSIPAMESLRAIDQYSKMLLICFKGVATDLTAKDHAFLAERGLEAEEMDGAEITSLFGLLKPEAANELKFYMLRYSGEQDDSQSVIRDNPELLSRNTEAQDDLVLRWCDPRTVTVDGQDYRLVGLTLPNKRQTGGWIQNFLQPQSPWFSYEESTNSPLTVRGDVAAIDIIADREVQFASGVRARLQRLGPRSDEEQSPPAASDGNAFSALYKSTVYVPVSLLALLNQASRNQAALDSDGKKFVPAPSPISFTKARMYTATIDDVPLAADMLAKRKYAVLSEVSRIAEIQNQNRSLDVLVRVVAIGVFLFGVITVFSVLVDSTDRKKGVIGILRVMGISGPGVFFILLIRAIMIGVMAAALCCGVGALLASLLSPTEHIGKPESRAQTSSDTRMETSHQLRQVDGAAAGKAWTETSIVLRPSDYLLVCLGAILCAALGVLMPALKASRLDPFDAIMEGQFH